jgi:cell shape-determining protein MreD
VRPTLLGLGRAAYVVVAVFLTATLLPRLGVPAGWVPDLVLLGVATSAVLRGPVHGALVGLAAGWVVELVPPVGSPLGLTPLVMMVGGLVAGLFHRPSSRSAVRPYVALLAACAVVGASRVATTIVAEGSVDLAASAGRIAGTVGVGLVLVPLLIAADRALVRRRLG